MDFRDAGCFYNGLFESFPGIALFILYAMFEHGLWTDAGNANVPVVLEITVLLA